MKRYLIDGNNVVCIWKSVAKPTQSQEDQFLALVRSSLRRNDKAVVVFDGPPRTGFRGSSTEVRYSGQQKADDILIHLIENAPEAAQLVVVSDDRQIRESARHCQCLKASEFLAKALKSDHGPEKPGRVSPEETEQWIKDFEGRNP